MHASRAVGFWADWEARPRDPLLGQPPPPARPATISPSASAGELEESQLSPRKLIKSLTAAGLTLEASVVEVRPGLGGSQERQSSGVRTRHVTAEGTVLVTA